MGQYKVDLEDGGSMIVNASSPQAARDNVVSSGNTPKGSGSSSGSRSGSSGSSSGGGNSGGGTYDTVNGPKTPQQMASELKAVGWNGDSNNLQAVVNAYATTTGGSAQPSNNGSGNSGNDDGLGGMGTTTQTNLDQFNTSTDQAMKQAYQEYLNAKLRNETDQQAFDHAQQAFTNEITKAGLTGMYNGQQTQAAQAQQFGQGISAAGLTGIYNGQETLGAQSQYFNQALAQQTQNQKTTQDYLSLIAGLRGPQDYGQYLRVLASTPTGLQGLVGAAAGQLGRIPGFGVNPGTAPQGASLQGLMGAGATGVSGAGAPQGGAGTSYADYQAAAQGLPPPSQIAPQAWNSMNDSQKKLLLGMYESTGWNLTDAQQAYNNSLPKYGAQAGQTGSVKLV
jgi:hypothetical protein